MELKLFGCCSGTEPMPKYKHTAFALEAGGEVYWFDAGEGCTDTALLMGVELSRVTNIFISHTHMDHVGGLFGLLWFLYKLPGWHKKPMLSGGKVGLFIPNMETWEGVLQMLISTREGCPWDTDVVATQIRSGVIFRDKNIDVIAYHNRHLEAYENGSELSFSFKIRGEGKTVVYSGDVKELSDLDPLLEEPCDYLLVETGHHRILDLCSYVNQKSVDNVILIHHGREVLSNVQQARLTAQKYAKCNVFFGEDGDSITL